MMDELYILCANLKNEIRDLNQKSDISPTELDRVYKAVDIIKDIKTIEAMEDAGYSNARGGNSRAYYEDSYERGRSNMMYPGYFYDEPGMSGARGGNSREYSEEGNSYRRGRDSMGRYTSREGGYSGHEEEKEQMMREIDNMRHRVQQM